MREDRAKADFILRAFANTNVKPAIKECSDNTIIFEPGSSFENTIQESSAIFVLLTAAAANNKHLNKQFISVCSYAATKMKDIWILEPAEQFVKIRTTIAIFKHYVRFQVTDGWASYWREVVKSYDDSSVPALLAATAGGGALLTQNDKLAGGFLGLLAGFGLLLLSKSNQPEFGREIVCKTCGRAFRLHLTAGVKEYRCAGCGLFYIKKNSLAFNTLSRGRQSPADKTLFSPDGKSNLIMTENIKTPTAFISYSWDDDKHKAWVSDLATRLRNEGVDVTLDRWHLAPGDPLPEFMESAVRENDFVLLICTPNFKAKADERKGGVGYEGNVITGEIYLHSNHRKFIPILRHENWSEAAPSWVQAKRYIDLTDRHFDENFEELVKTLHDERIQPPPLGKRKHQKSPVGFSKTMEPDAVSKSDEIISIDDRQLKSPIKITGIIREEITKPRMDETPGSGLYSVPFRLSSRPPEVWAKLFVENWANPPSFTTMHRPKIARVFSDKIVLDGTTIEEVEKYHRDTLLAVVEITNRQFDQYQTRLQQETEIKRQHESKQKGTIDDMLKRIKFE